MKHYTTNCKGIDKLLHGGIESGTLTQVYGAPGTGKTTICLQTAIANAETSKLLYIDTDNCSKERCLQILGNSKPPPISYIRPETLQEQRLAIEKLKRSQELMDTRVGLVLVDTITLLYRLALNDEKHPRQELGNQVLTLLEIARKYNTAILVTNQVYKDLSTNEIRPAGGYALEHLSKVIVELKKSKEGHGNRIATLRRYHEGLNIKQTQKLRITEGGIQ